MQKRSAVSIIYVFALLGAISLASCGKAKARQYTEQNMAVAPMGHSNAACCPADKVEPMGELKWALPAGWKTKPSTGMRLASFQTANDLDCSIIPLSGTVGGIAANIRRWLEQMNVNIDAKDLDRFCKAMPTSASKGGIAYQMADLTPFTGTSGESIIVAVSTFSDTTVFIKIKGEKNKVLADRKALVALCDSLTH